MRKANAAAAKQEAEASAAAENKHQEDLKRVAEMAAAAAAKQAMEAQLGPPSGTRQGQLALPAAVRRYAGVWTAATKAVESPSPGQLGLTHGSRLGEVETRALDQISQKGEARPKGHGQQSHKGEVHFCEGQDSHKAETAVMAAAKRPENPSPHKGEARPGCHSRYSQKGETVLESHGQDSHNAANAAMGRSAKPGPGTGGVLSRVVGPESSRATNVAKKGCPAESGPTGSAVKSRNLDSVPTSGGWLTSATAAGLHVTDKSSCEEFNKSLVGMALPTALTALRSVEGEAMWIVDLGANVPVLPPEAPEVLQVLDGLEEVELEGVGGIQTKKQAWLDTPVGIHAGLVSEGSQPILPVCLLQGPGFEVRSPCRQEWDPDHRAQRREGRHRHHCCGDTEGHGNANEGLAQGRRSKLRSSALRRVGGVCDGSTLPNVQAHEPLRLPRR